MTEYGAQKHIIRPEYMARIEQFRLLDDTFFSVVFDNKPKPTQRMLQIILARDDIEVLEVKAQYKVPNLLDHDVTLDILARDASGKKFDVEVQRNSSGASPRRARYHLALIDARSLEKGTDFDQLPDNYVIFITEEDTRCKNQAVSVIERFHDDGDAFGDGSHIVYVNGAYRAAPGETTDLAKLIHDFRCTRPEDMQVAELAEQVYYYKRTEGGITGMCKVMEEFGQKERTEQLLLDIRNLIEATNWTPEHAMDVLKIPAEQRPGFTAKL